ncbi:MAG: ester cyclase [Chitinophagaceae bacterium]|nr:ester cyclase [Chitinophagaceae bacterium]
MKKILFAAFAMCMFASCTNDATTTTKVTTEEQKNVAASDVIMKAFQTGDISGIDSVVSDDFLDHTDRGDMKGRDSLKSMVKFVTANFTNMKTEKKREVADGEYVWSWLRFTGNSNGTVPGMPKGPYDMESIELSKFKDGKAVEHWSFMEVQDMMKMMPPPPPPSKNTTDTTKK